MALTATPRCRDSGEPLRRRFGGRLLPAARLRSSRANPGTSFLTVNTEKGLGETSEQILWCFSGLSGNERRRMQEGGKDGPTQAQVIGRLFSSPGYERSTFDIKSPNKIGGKLTFGTLWVVNLAPKGLRTFLSRKIAPPSSRWPPRRTSPPSGSTTIPPTPNSTSPTPARARCPPWPQHSGTRDPGPQPPRGPQCPPAPSSPHPLAPPIIGPHSPLCRASAVRHSPRVVSASPSASQSRALSTRPSHEGPRVAPTPTPRWIPRQWKREM